MRGRRDSGIEDETTTPRRAEGPIPLVRASGTFPRMGRRGLFGEVTIGSKPGRLRDLALSMAAALGVAGRLI